MAAGNDNCAYLPINFSFLLFISCLTNYNYTGSLSSQGPSFFVTLMYIVQHTRAGSLHATARQRNNKQKNKAVISKVCKVVE